MPRTLNTEIRDLQKQRKSLQDRIDFLKEVQKILPDVKMNGSGYFISKQAGNLVNKIEFDVSSYNGLYVLFSYKTYIEIDGNKKDITIYLMDDGPYSYIPIITESQVAWHPYKVRICQYMKILNKLNIPDKYIHQVRMRLIKYMSDNAPQYKFDLTTLEPRLKNLIAFM
jgi:hypothetical protein